MKLVVTEKNIAAQKIAALLSDGPKPQADKVYNTPCYRFTHEGEEWVSVGLKGHILAVEFPVRLSYSKRGGWIGVDKDGEVIEARIDSALDKPPFKKRKPFLEDGVELKGWKIDALPYLVWAPIVKEPAEREIIRALKNLAKKADEIIIATDFDREGELIGSDAVTMVREVNASAPISRARYSAITKGEIEQAFNSLVTVDNDLASAGESRQFIDLIWGAVLTRYLTLAKPSGFGNVRSAGRVQTPTLAIVCNHEKERRAFVPEDYWLVKAQVASGSETFGAEHVSNRFKNEKQAQDAYQRAQSASEGVVVSRECNTSHKKPPTPFNTTSLQTAASALGLSPARTMRIAESLYMNGYISYPRVDNTVYPSSLDLAGVVKALKKVPQYAPYCDEVLSSPLHPTRGATQTTDHPPIYPVTAAQPEKLKPEEWRLYNLIARRFLATLGEQAVVDTTTVKIDLGQETFKASGDVLVKPGFRAIYTYGLKKDELLPPLEVGDKVEVIEVTCEAKQTEPPARYSQGRLIKEMEKAGLGTKSTRHAIIERLYEVKYIKNDPIEPSQLGMAIIDALTQYAPHVTSPQMTAELEAEMDNIAQGQRAEGEVVDHSRAMLGEMLAALIERKDDLGAAISDAVDADARVGACPKCGKDLQIKSSLKTRSNFIGCSGWPDCDVTFPLPQGKIEPVEEACPVCGAPQIKVQPFRQKAYITCVDPKCPTNQEPEIIVGTCPICAEQGRHGDLVAQRSDRSLKRFIRCTNYEQCEVSYPLPQRGELHATGETCEHCGAPIVEVITSRGPWRLCVNMDCPAKADQAQKKSGAKKGRSAKSSRAGAKKATGSKSTQKATRKRTTSSKSKA